MATVDEILSAMTEDDTYAVADEVLLIDPDTRQISVPKNELVFGVEDDTRSERKYFRCPRYVGNKLDLASCFVRVPFRNANGEVDAYLVEDLAVDGDAVTFSWELSRKVTMYKGQIQFLVSFNCAATGKDWHTTLATGAALEGMETDAEAAEAATADVIAQLLAIVDRQTAAVQTEGAAQVAAVQAEGDTQTEAVQNAASAAQAAAVAEIEAKGTNTLASIPDDYTALSAAVDAVTRGSAPGIVCDAAGEVITVSDASEQALAGLRVFGRSTQDGTPTPDAPVEIVSVDKPVVTVTDGTDTNAQTLATTHPLPGIPVASGGNYTDANGQRWICDEVDFKRGVYVQRVYAKAFDGTEKWFKTDTTDLFQASCYLPELSQHAPGVSTHYLIKTKYSTADKPYFRTIPSGAILYYEDIAENYSTVEDWQGYLADQYTGGSPVIVQYILATPIETPLSETELAAWAALHSNKPHTTILNDAGAHMAAEYVADTKLYIDNAIARITG